MCIASKRAAPQDHTGAIAAAVAQHAKHTGQADTAPILPMANPVPRRSGHEGRLRTRQHWLDAGFQRSDGSRMDRQRGPFWPDPSAAFWWAWPLCLLSLSAVESPTSVSPTSAGEPANPETTGRRKPQIPETRGGLSHLVQAEGGRAAGLEGCELQDIIGAADQAIRTPGGLSWPSRSRTTSTRAAESATDVPTGRARGHRGSHAGCWLHERSAVGDRLRVAGQASRGHCRDVGPGHGPDFDDPRSARARGAQADLGGDRQGVSSL